MGVALANKNKTLGQVQKHIAREQYDRAIKLLQQLVEEDPNDVRSLLKLGDVHVKKGDRDVAVEVYKQVAKQYSEQGFFMKSVAIYKQILRHQSKNIEALMQLAELYEHLGLASEARQQYLLAESVLQDQGDTSAALALMQKQVELDPDNVAHRIKLAEAYSSQDNIAAATRQFAAAADVLRRQNREEDFIKVAERLVYHDPNRPEVLRDLARMYLGRGDAKRALAKLQLCFRSQPKDVETLELLAQAFSELRQYTRTKTVYQELVQVLDDQGMVGRAEEYRLLIRQLEEADRPSPASPVPPDSAGGAPLSPAASISPADPGPDTGYNPQEYMYAAEAGNGISSSDHAMAAYGGEFDSQDVYAPEPNGAFHDSAGYDLPADAAFAAPAH
ncbi:MAG: tetratricopeptide repeat protein, partial [Myxococcota bacterium]